MPFSKVANDDAIRICELEAAHEIVRDKVSAGDMPVELLYSIEYEIKMLMDRIPMALEQERRVNSAIDASRVGVR